MMSIPIEDSKLVVREHTTCFLHPDIDSSSPFKLMRCRVTCMRLKDKVQDGPQYISERENITVIVRDLSNCILIINSHFQILVVVIHCIYGICYHYISNHGHAFIRHNHLLVQLHFEVCITFLPSSVLRRQPN